MDGTRVVSELEKELKRRAGFVGWTGSVPAKQFTEEWAQQTFGDESWETKTVSCAVVAVAPGSEEAEPRYSVRYFDGCDPWDMTEPQINRWFKKPLPSLNRSRSSSSGKNGCKCTSGCVRGCPCKVSTHGQVRQECTDQCHCGDECKNRSWVPCVCAPSCGSDCKCRSGFGCQDRCGCKGECTEGAKARLERLQVAINQAHGTNQSGSGQEEAPQHEVKGANVNDREVKTPTLEILAAQVKEFDGQLRALHTLVKDLQEKQVQAMKQIEELSKERAEAKLERKTQQVEFASLAARVKATEANRHVAALAQQVARSDIVAAPLPVFLVTGLKEAVDWERDEGEHIVEYLQPFGCAEGISRVERLGRRQRNHTGGGRYILAEMTDVGALRLKEAKESLEKKGVRFRVAEGGFRFRAARPRPQPQHAPPAGRQAPSASASAASLAAPGDPEGRAPPPSRSSAGQSGQAKLVCRRFQKGECPDVRSCVHAHLRVCFDYAEKGSCRFGDEKGTGCKFHHIRYDEDVGARSEWHGASRWNRQSRSDKDRERDVRGMAPPPGHGRGARA